MSASALRDIRPPPRAADVDLLGPTVRAVWDALRRVCSVLQHFRWNTGCRSRSEKKITHAHVRHASADGRDSLRLHDKHHWPTAALCLLVLTPCSCLCFPPPLPTSLCSPVLHLSGVVTCACPHVRPCTRTCVRVHARTHARARTHTQICMCM